MDKRLVILIVLAIGVFLIGCSKSPTGDYAAYNQPQQQGQQPYVGGGCGVAPSGDVANTPVEAFGSGNSEL